MDKMVFYDIKQYWECNCGGTLTASKDGSGRWVCDSCDYVSTLSYPTGKSKNYEHEQDV